jgi:hypothetical protein
VKKRDEIAEGIDKPYYTVSDLMKIFGLDEEQVKRNGRKGIIPGRMPGTRAHHYLKEIVDRWIRSGGQIPRKPVTPAQEQAYQLCASGDHSWFEDEKFDGIACETEIVSDVENMMVTLRTKRTCYFYGHTELGSP